MGRVSGIIVKMIGLGLITILLAGCALLARPVGQIAKPEESATIVGYLRYYAVHLSAGEIYRIDSSWLGGSMYAVKVEPGLHLVVLNMTQYSIMNWPLIVGSGQCALILTAEPGKTYHVSPPSFGTYYRFWSRPGFLGFVPLKRFRSTVNVDVSGGDDPARSLDLPIDCQSDEFYCRVASDCVDPAWKQPDAKLSDAGRVPPECIYDGQYPVGTCSLMVPAHSPDDSDIKD